VAHAWDTTPGRTPGGRARQYSADMPIYGDDDAPWPCGVKACGVSESSPERARLTHVVVGLERWPETCWGHRADALDACPRLERGRISTENEELQDVLVGYRDGGRRHPSSGPDRLAQEDAVVLSATPAANRGRLLPRQRASQRPTRLRTYRPEARPFVCWFPVRLVISGTQSR